MPCGPVMGAFEDRIVVAGVCRAHWRGIARQQEDELRYSQELEAYDLCRHEESYENLFYGAVQAPDVKTAEDFVYRREDLQATLVDKPWGDSMYEREKELKALSEEFPSVRLDTAFKPNCNLDCY